MNNIIIGVDTHKANNVAVAIDALGARLGGATIPSTRKGYSLPVPPVEDVTSTQ
jgi:hypothetical protein